MLNSLTETVKKWFEPVNTNTFTYLNNYYLVGNCIDYFNLSHSSLIPDENIKIQINGYTVRSFEKIVNDNMVFVRFDDTDDILHFYEDQEIEGLKVIHLEDLY